MSPLENNNYQEAQLEVVENGQLNKEDLADIDLINNYLKQNFASNDIKSIQNLESSDKGLTPTERKTKEAYNRLKNKIDTKMLQFVEDKADTITLDIYKNSENISNINISNKLDNSEKSDYMKESFDNISSVSSELWINHRNMSRRNITDINQNIKNGYKKLLENRRDTIYNKSKAYKNNPEFKRNVSSLEVNLKSTLYKLNSYGSGANDQNRLKSGGNFNNDIKSAKIKLLDATKDFLDNRHLNNYDDVYGEGAKDITSMLKSMRDNLVSNMDKTIKIFDNKEKIKTKNTKESEKNIFKIKEKLDLQEKDQKRGMLKKLSEENKRVVSEYVKDNNSKIKTYTISGLADGIKFIPGGPGEKNVDNNYSKLKNWIKENKINIPNIPEKEKNNPNYKLARNRAVKFLYDLEPDTRNQILEKGVNWDISTTEQKDEKGTYRLGSIEATFVDINSIESQQKNLPKYLNFINFQTHPQDGAATLYGDTAKHSIFIGGDKGTGWNYIGNKLDFPNTASKEAQDIWLDGDIQTDVDYILLKIFSGKENPDEYKVTKQGHTLPGLHGGMEKYEKKIRNKVDSVVKNIREGKYESVAVLESIFERNGIDSTGYDYGYLKIKGEPK